MEASLQTDADSRDAAYAGVQATAEAQSEHPAEGRLAGLAAQTEQALQQLHVGTALLLSSKCHFVLLPSLIFFYSKRPNSDSEVV